MIRAPTRSERHSRAPVNPGRFRVPVSAVVDSSAAPPVPLCLPSPVQAKAYGLCMGHLDQLDRGKPPTPLLGLHGRKYDGCTFPPNAKSRKGWIAEHVWVMTQILGRPLRDGETVHHRNLIKGDNTPSNLQLWTSHQPRGTSVGDMLAWCRWFIELYEDAPEWTLKPGGPLSQDDAVIAGDQSHTDIGPGP